MTGKDRKWKVGWGFTSACNMSCPFCYSALARAERFRLPREYRAHLRFVEQNASCIDSINWGTGENSLSRQWFELVSAIHQMAPHIPQAVTTNGYLARAVTEDQQLLEIFLKCLAEVDVSLDFHLRDQHNEFRGNSQAFDWAIRTIELCTDAGKPLTIVLLGCAETLRVENLEGIFALAQKYDCLVRINVLRPVKGVHLQPAGYGQIKAMLIHLVRNYRVVSLADPLFGALLGEVSPDPSGRSSLRILPDGAVTPSTYLVDEQWIAANIIEDGFELDDLDNAVPFSAMSSASIPTSCCNCILVDNCQGGCKDRRVLWYGTLDVSDPYCPARYDGDFDWLKANWKKRADARGPLVHDGYLPTLIFHP